MFSRVKPVVRQYIVVILVNLVALSVGVGLAWPSPVLVKLRNETETVLPRPISENEGSWIVSIGFLTGLVTNFTAGYLLDRIGRKACLIVGCVPRISACLILTFASEYWMLLLGRAINGISEGLSFNIVSVYASEIASKEVRGSLGTILQIMSSLGIVLMLSMGPFTSYIVLNVVYTCIVVSTSLPLLMLPDSPYFLYAKGRTEQAYKVLIFLRGSETLAKEEIKEYSLSNTTETISRKEIVKNKVFIKGVSIAIVLGVGSQLVGFNAVTFYLQTVLESTGTSVSPEVSSVIIGLIQLTASFVAALVTDRFGRKPIISWSLVGMAIGMLGLGVFFHIREVGSSVVGIINFLPLVSLILVVFCYSGGMGSLNWSLTAELFDGPSRGMGVSISLTISYISLFLTTRYFPLATLAVGPSPTYWFFSVNCVLMCLFILFCVPETKGRSFSEIQRALDGKRMEDGKENNEMTVRVGQLTKNNIPS